MIIKITDTSYKATFLNVDNFLSVNLFSLSCDLHCRADVLSTLINFTITQEISDFLYRAILLNCTRQIASNK